MRTTKVKFFRKYLSEGMSDPGKIIRPGRWMFLTWGRLMKANSQKQRCLALRDHIYVNDSMLRDIHSSAVIEYDISDHMPTFLSLNVGATKKAPNRPLVRKITEIKRDVFLNELNQKLRYLDMQNNLDFEKLINVMKELVDSHFPLVRQSRKQLKYSHKPWITKGILTSIKTQNRLYKKYLKSKCEINCKTYKMYRNKLTHIKEMSKSNYYIINAD